MRDTRKSAIKISFQYFLIDPALNMTCSFKRIFAPWSSIRANVALHRPTLYRLRQAVSATVKIFEEVNFFRHAFTTIFSIILREWCLQYLDVWRVVCVFNSLWKSGHQLEMRWTQFENCHWQVVKFVHSMYGEAWIKYATSQYIEPWFRRGPYQGNSHRSHCRERARLWTCACWAACSGPFRFDPTTSPFCSANCQPCASLRDAWACLCLSCRWILCWCLQTLQTWH